jgi:hypothetical protein
MATTYQTQKECDVWQPWWRDLFMKLFKRNDYSTGNKPVHNTTCLQTNNWKWKWAYRSRVWRKPFMRECVAINEIWVKNKCVKIPGCKSKDMNQKVCSVCNAGYELQVKGKSGWKSRYWYEKTRKLKEYKKYWKSAKRVRCNTCGYNEVYSTVIKECRPKLKKAKFVYHIPQPSDGGKHYFFNVKRHYNSKVAAISFEMDLKNITRIDGDVLAKVSLKASDKQVACATGSCYYKKMRGYKGVENKKCRYTQTLHNWVMHRNNNLKYCGWNRKFKKSNSVRWYSDLNYDSFFDKTTQSPYLKLTGTFVMRTWQPEYSFILELFNTAGNYDQFYLGGFKYRIDYKAKKRWQQ